MMNKLTRDDWRTRAEALRLPKYSIIDGMAVVSDGQDYFDNINPATKQIICTLPVGSATDVARAVDVARRSVIDKRWSGLSPLTRKSILLKLADLIVADGETLALYDSLEMGKTISDATQDVMVAAGFFQYYAEAIDKITSPVVPAHDSTLAFNLYEPLGVVAAIVPWNYPVINAALKAAPALAAGNSVVLKPSEITSFSAVRLAELALQAGVPAGVFNVVIGLGVTVGAALAAHSDVDMISFTGSTATGRAVMTAAAQSNGKRVALECGGKSPQIVFADMADALDDIATEVAREAFANQGQLCVARTRLLVERPIKDKLVAAVEKATTRLVPGDPLDPATTFGAIASAAQWEKVIGYIRDGAAAAARPLRPLSDLAAANGYFIPPIIFDDVQPAMKIAQEEIFGPVLSVLTFDTVDDALSLANDSIYGLAATAWTRDYRIMNVLMRGLHAGKVILRAVPTQSEKAGFALAAEPFKQSGFGAEFGMAGFKSYTRRKAIELIG